MDEEADEFSEEDLAVNDGGGMGEEADEFSEEDLAVNDGCG